MKTKTVKWIYKINRKYDLDETLLEGIQSNPHWRWSINYEEHTLQAEYEIPEDADPNTHSGIVYK
jgi:hypothetical protein